VFDSCSARVIILPEEAMAQNPYLRTKTRHSREGGNPFD